MTENGDAEQGGSLDAENVCGAHAARFLAAQLTLVVRLLWPGGVMNEKKERSLLP